MRGAQLSPCTQTAPVPVWTGNALISVPSLVVLVDRGSYSAGRRGLRVPPPPSRRAGLLLLLRPWGWRRASATSVPAACRRA